MCNESYPRNSKTVRYGTKTISLSFLSPKIVALIPLNIKDSKTIHKIYKGNSSFYVKERANGKV